MQKIVAFGDALGIKLLLPCLPNNACLVGVVAAASRTQSINALQKIANNLNIPCLIQPKFHSVEYLKFYDQLKLLLPHWIIVSSYSMKLYPDILALPAKAAINIHTGLLPEYRGANPTQWAIINGETETGVTVHYMNEEIDTGDIIAQSRVPICFKDTWKNVQNRLVFAAKNLLTEELTNILEGKSLRHPQAVDSGKYFRRRFLEDGLFNWHMPIIDIYNLIRALVRPLPGAYYHKENVRITLDAFHNIAKLLRMKYTELGQDWLATEHIFLRPMKRNRDNSLSFAVNLKGINHFLGTCGVIKMDYTKSDASLSVNLLENTEQTIYNELVEFLKSFSSNELKLSRVNYAYCCSNSST